MNGECEHILVATIHGPRFFLFILSDPPTIQQAITSAVKSWIGQTVTLKCVSDGVPTPTLTWYKPDGSQISSNTATEYTVNVKMNVDQDFGDYKCNANNGLTPADNKIVSIKQIGKLSLLPLKVSVFSFFLIGFVVVTCCWMK